MRSSDRFAFPLSEEETRNRVREALLEDRAFEDVTTIATVMTSRHARAAMVARRDGVISGIPLAVAAFQLMDSHSVVRVDKDDGDRAARGETVLFINGSARGVLSAERVALNFMQRLSGIASATAGFIDAVKGTGVEIVDTRKTLPGWRALEKYAVRCGGGTNHRATLADAVLIKDNHIAACDGRIDLAIERARAFAPPGMLLQVECDTADQVKVAVESGADAILLDNMSNEQLRECVEITRGHCWTEASGGVNLDTVRGIAETGVDRISIGAITHSVSSLDLGLDFD